MAIKKGVDEQFYALISDPENIGLACEVVSQAGSASKVQNVGSSNAISTFLQRPNNKELVSLIREQFAPVLVRLVKTVLLKQITKECKTMLSGNDGWEVLLHPSEEDDLRTDPWPGINITLKGLSDVPHWSFYLQLERALESTTQKLPLRFCHGIIYSDDGPRRCEPVKKSMPLTDMLAKLRIRMKAYGLTVSPASHSANWWFSSSKKAYDLYSLGDKPQVVSKIHSDVLAQEIGIEFKTLFDEYSDDLRELNAALRASMSNIPGKTKKHRTGAKV